MKNQKSFKFVSESARVQTPSALNKLITAIQEFFSITPASSNELIPVRSVYRNEMTRTTRQEALINMLNQGKHYDHADLILNEAEEWELDYDLLNPSKVAVHGKSVWIDAQD